MKVHFELRDSIHSPILYGTSYESKSIHGVILFIHDVNESRFRYESVASFFNARHMVFVTYDLRGHHQSLIDDKKGHFGDDHGSNTLMKDGLDVYAWIKERYPYVPIILMGQGFGAHLAKIIFDYRPDSFFHLVLVNPLSLPKMAKLYRALLTPLTYRNPKAKKRVLNKWMAKTIESQDEWERYSFLSHNKAIVNQYLHDPFCGYQLTQRAIRDALTIMIISKETDIQLSNADIGVTIIGGKDNLLTNYGRDLVYEKRQFIKAGYSLVTMSIFEKLKHDVLLEINTSYDLSQLLDSICFKVY